MDVLGNTNQLGKFQVGMKANLKKSVMWLFHNGDIDAETVMRLFFVFNLYGE